MKESEKKHGAGAVMLLGESEPVKVEVIPTGLVSLDYCIRQPKDGIGMGGIPIGRVTELYGVESSGKSTLLLQVIGHAQRRFKRYCALIDSEHAFDPNYARSLGVDVENLVMSQPQCGEEALDIAESLIKSDVVDLLAVDSAAMLTPRAEIEGEIGDSHPGSRARMLTQALSRLVGILQNHHVAVVFINQLRDKIGFSGYGDPTMTPCGRSLKHNASLRIEVRRLGALKLSEKIVGFRTRFRIAKNKLGPPAKETQADMLFGQGFSYYGDLIDFAVERGVMKKAGATFELGQQKFTRGREALREHLLENHEWRTALVEALMADVQKTQIAAGNGHA